MLFVGDKISQKTVYKIGLKLSENEYSTAAVAKRKTPAKSTNSKLRVQRYR